MTDGLIDLLTDWVSDYQPTLDTSSCKPHYVLKITCFYFQLIKSDLDGTIDAIQNKLDERALLRQKKVLSLN